MARSPSAKCPYAWGVIAWISGVHIVGIPIAVMYIAFFGYKVQTVILAVALFYIVHLSITAGMHRLYAHRAFTATKALEVFLLMFSAAAAQGPAVWWAGMHRRHHAKTDQDEDPYSTKHGFWWAHMLCAAHQLPPPKPKEVSDLLRNRLVMLQRKHYKVLAMLMGLGLPTALAAVWGDPLGGLLIAGFMRLVFQFHLTWVINSVAHSVGSRRYPGRGTPRTNWWLALFTGGESYHERHHFADQDYRLGNRWYDLDLGKWFVWLNSKIGLASGLKIVPEEEVLARAQAQAHM